MLVCFTLLLCVLVLQRASDHYQLQATLSTLGPSVVIFHETQYTGLLGEGDSTRCAQEVQFFFCLFVFVEL